MLLFDGRESGLVQVSAIGAPNRVLKSGAVCIVGAASMLLKISPAFIMVGKDSMVVVGREDVAFECRDKSMRSAQLFVNKLRVLVGGNESASGAGLRDCQKASCPTKQSSVLPSMR